MSVLRRDFLEDNTSKAEHSRLFDSPNRRHKRQASDKRGKADTRRFSLHWIIGAHAHAHAHAHVHAHRDMRHVFMVVASGKKLSLETRVLSNPSRKEDR